MEGAHTSTSGGNTVGGASSSTVSPEDASPRVFVPVYAMGERSVEITTLGVFTSELAAVRAMIAEINSMEFIRDYMVADDLETYKKRRQETQQPTNSVVDAASAEATAENEDDEHDDYELLEEMLIDFYAAAKASQKPYKRRRKQTSCDEERAKSTAALRTMIEAYVSTGDCIFQAAICCHPLNSQPDKRDPNVVLL
jgi:hypothetical protein